MQSDHVEYAKLSVLEMDDGDEEGQEVTVSFRQPAPISTSSALDSAHGEESTGALRNEYPFPISRPPSKQRDWVYGVAFLAHFVAVIFVSFVEQSSLQHSAISYNRAGSWASMVMIMTLIGGLVGGLVSIGLVSYEGRATVLQYGITSSLILKIVMGNIMFIMRSPYSFLGIFVLLSAFWDSVRVKSARTSLPFSSALIDLVGNISRQYGIWLAVICGLIVATQTLVLIWWGAFFIGAISTIPDHFVAVASLVLLFSLYWITQFFQVMLSFVVGGCVLWFFLHEEQEECGALPSNSNPPTNNNNSNNVVTKQLGLYLQCAITTSFGSLCKGAVFMAPAQMLLQARYHSLRRQHRWPWICRCLVTACDRSCGLCLYPMARHYHRLSLCLLAVYGRTLLRTAEDQMQYHPETLNSSLEDTTAYALDCLASCIAGIVAILFGLLAERGEAATWPLFIFVSFCLASSGASLALSTYSAAVDALIVAAALTPQQLAKHNQLVYLRFLRTAEAEQQTLSQHSMPTA